MEKSTVALSWQIMDNPGMRLAKLVLTCLVCLGVSVQGFASVTALEAPCPMTQAGVESAEDPAMQGDMSHDCCNDAATFAKTGKLCKTDLTCQSLSQAPQTAFNLVLFAPTAEPAVPIPERVIRTLEPVPVWRPPALI
ncbi:MAG: hypothetical protein M3Y79_10360 [Pseudomonadota bacterium]|nr:hypothetical protein [Pseudomonadota bacterium]